MPTLLKLKKLLSMNNKALVIPGIWKMKKEQVLKAIQDAGFRIVESGNNVELRPLGAKTHIRKRVQKVRK